MTDVLDLRILEQLHRNARIKNNHLAKLVGLSAPACLQRVRRLEKAGIIAGYRAILNWQVAGVGFDAWADITLCGSSGKTVGQFVDFLRGSPLVYSAHQLGGTRDFLLHVVATSFGSWKAFLERASDDGFDVEVGRVSLTLECVKQPLASPCFCRLSVAGQ